VASPGQPAQGRLLDPRWQRDLLDAFGGLSDLRAAMAMAVGRWRENRTALDAAAMDPREMARTLDLLDHEADEIETARLRPGEAAELDARRSAAQHGEEIVRGAAAIHTALVGEGRGARDATGAAVAEARSLARVDPRFDPLAKRLAGLEAEVIDAADDARRLADGVDHDPGAIADLDARVAVIHGMLRRYGDDEAAVIAHGERVAAEAERLRGLDAERVRRQTEDVERLAEVARAGGALSEARGRAAVALAGAVDSALRELGFPPAAFDIEVGRLPADADEPAVEIDGDAVLFDETGVDQVVYRFAPNPGEPGRPLARIASGGEL
jgi:DNA repair protein RecN (Recombination protein N)